eukprot:SAG22_NODE_1419_length_4466_cov_5.588963_4_plen_558_part_00
MTAALFAAALYEGLLACATVEAVAVLIPLAGAGAIVHVALRGVDAAPRAKVVREELRQVHARRIAGLLDEGAAGLQRLRLTVAERGCPPENDHLRRRVWMRLLRLDDDVAPAAATASAAAAAPTHPQDEQLWLDVNRSLHHYKPRLYTQHAATQSACRAALFRMMQAVLLRDGALHYYQGFHDVASVLLLTCGPAAGTRLLQALAASPLAFAVTADMAATSNMMQLLPPLVREVCPEAAEIIRAAGIEDPIYALSWVLTWFAHDLHSLAARARLVDFFLAVGHPLASVYFAAVVVGHRLPELKAIREQPPDYGAVHALLRTVPAGLPLDRLCSQTLGAATVLSFKGSDRCLSLCFSSFPCGSTALTEDRCNQGCCSAARRTRGCCGSTLPSHRQTGTSWRGLLAKARTVSANILGTVCANLWAWPSSSFNECHSITCTPATACSQVLARADFVGVAIALALLHGPAKPIGHAALAVGKLLVCLRRFDNLSVARVAFPARGAVCPAKTQHRAQSVSGQLADARATRTHHSSQSSPIQPSMQPYAFVPASAGGGGAASS